MMKKILLLLFCLALVQSLGAETKRFFINRFGIGEGLASNKVLTIQKDQKGFLWIGTANGLQRFDGRKFMNYRIRTPENQASKSVSEILFDQTGKMWLRVGEDYGYYHPEGESFVKVPFENPENVSLGESIWMDSKGRLFVILHNNKLLWIDQENGKITDANIPIQMPEGWRPRSVFEDHSGRFWISSMEGISVYDPVKNQIYTSENNPLGLPVLDRKGLISVTNVYQDSQGMFWVNYWAPDEYLVSYNPKTKVWKNHKPEIAPPNQNYQEAFGVIELPDGGIWRYGVQTLADLDRANNRFNRLAQSDLSYDKISKVIWDAARGLWLATDNGLYFIHFDTPDIYFHQFDTQGGNYELQAVREIIHQGDTSMWLGSWGKGVLTFKLREGQVNSDWLRVGAPNRIESFQVWDILHDPKRGWVWIGLQKGLLMVADLNSKKAFYLSPKPFNGSTIRTIAQDKNGDIWFGTQSGELIQYSGNGLQSESFRRIRKFQGRIPKILFSKDQNLWVTTDNEGVYILNGLNGEVIRHMDNSILNSNDIQRIIQLNDSIFLMGTELLNKYNFQTGKNEIFSFSEGMVSNGILHLEADRNQIAWIYTPNGLTRFDALTNTFSSFGPNHFFAQIPSDGHGGSRFSTGELAFVSNNSVLLFDPLQFDRYLIPQAPDITSVELFGAYVGDGSALNPRRVFSSQENSLSFDFNILNFPLQDRFTYYYRLVGADPEWVEAQGNFRAVYSLLPPGEYRFEVRSANEVGDFSAINSYEFEIQPSLIQTWWFKAILAFLFLGTVGLIYRLHINRILAVVKIRTRLARDLHDDMGSTLSTINILSSMAKSKLGTDPSKTSEYISKISENSQRMMESMDDIVWSIKPQNDSMDKLIARMREFASQALESRDIHIEWEVKEKVLGMKLSMDAIRDLFLIFKEAINNLAKYSEADWVYIGFGLDKEHFWMKIKDNGIGFDPEEVVDGNGLGNMVKRAVSLGGHLSVNSRLKSGTEVFLKVKL